ncbi:MAG: hypothetical protein ACJ8CR_31495 [Roseiflexaceae bacterium]
MPSSVHKQTEQASTTVASPAAQRVGTRLPARYLLAGFLSGASGLVALLLLLALLLMIGALWPLLFDIASGMRGKLPFWQTVGQAVAQSLGDLPVFLWSARWGVLALGLLGLLLAFIDSRALRIERPWRHWLSLVVLLGMVGTLVFALQYANRENLLAWLAGQPSLVSLRESALVSDLAALVLGAVITLPATYVLWSLWQWWYIRWTRWLRLEQRSAPPVDAPATSDDDWRAYQARLHQIKRGVAEDRAAEAVEVQSAPLDTWLMRRLLLLLAVMVIALLGAVRLYDSSGSQLATDDLWISATSPEDLATLRSTRPLRQLIATGISGEGLVDITFGSDQGTAPLRQAIVMRLIGAGANYPSAMIDLVGLEPGRYWVKASLREGGGGQVRYTLLQGGGTLAQVAAWLIGLAAGSALALVLLVALEALTLRGWGQSRSVPQG